MCVAGVAGRHLPRRIGALVALASRSGFSQRLKRYGIEHNDGPMFEADPVTPRPDPQLLVDAFPGHADHFADFLLRNGDRPARRRELVFLRQTNKRAGKPARQILKNDLFDLIAGPSQAACKAAR